MSEVGPSPENIKIPESWDFLEKGRKDLKVIQLDQDHRFLAFTLQKRPKIKNSKYKGEYADYFFNRDGSPRDMRKHEYFDTHIKLGSEIKTIFSLHEWAGPPEHASLEVGFQQPGMIKVGTINEGIGAFHFGSMWEQKPYYARLETIYLGGVFMEGSQGNPIESPSSILGITLRKEGLKTEDWRFNTFSPSGGFMPQQEGKPNEIIFIDQEGKSTYKLEWEVTKEGIMVVSETHLPSKIVKTLRAPLLQNMTPVVEATFSRPPYSKERIGEKDRLVVPWRNIDRIVGASLSYSYPPQDSSKKQ